MQQVNDSTEPKYRKQQDNKCPDFLYFDLELKDTPTDRLQQAELPQKKDLYLTLNFNEEWLKLLGGKVKYGLRGGELRLSLKNCKTPYSDRCLNDEMKLVTEREVETQQGVEKSSNIGGSLSREKAELSAKQDYKNTETRKEKFQKTVYHVSTKGDERSPAWVFEADKDESVLKGTLADQKLATVDITEISHQLTATFEVVSKNVYVGDAEGIWPDNISQNKLAIIEKLIINRLLESKLKPYVSKVELSYE
ncbi:MAG: hypothetical protein WAN66_28520 [Limnoraphis robusta]|nr:hypothetical protein [Limnoraphis robusta]